MRQWNLKPLAHRSFAIDPSHIGMNEIYFWQILSPMIEVALPLLIGTMDISDDGIDVKFIWGFLHPRVNKKADSRAKSATRKLIA